MLDAVIDSVDEIYRMKEISKTRPIKGFCKCKITVFIIGGIVIVADLMGQSPLVLSAV